MGYKVVRVLDHYHRNNINMLLSESQLKSEIKDDLPTLSSTDLKVSIATNSNDSWSKTFDLNSQTLVNRGKTISSICKVPYPISHFGYTQKHNRCIFQLRIGYTQNGKESSC